MAGYAKKGKYRERPCIDCGRIVMMYLSRKRCPECARKHFLEYQRAYSRALWAERRARKQQEREQREGQGQA